jgi:hypothetical protein
VFLNKRPALLRVGWASKLQKEIKMKAFLLVTILIACDRCSKDADSGKDSAEPAAPVKEDTAS